MSLLIARDLSLSFGPRVILDEASFVIGAHDRIGLVGPNGSGKSTLLKIVARQAAPDAGSVQLMRRARAGYLPQDLAALPDGPLLEVVLATVPGRTDLEARLDEVQQALSHAADEEEQLDLSQQLADLHDTLDHFDQRYGAPRAGQILSGLGFAERDFGRLVHTLSGGWRMRVALAGLLLQEPDLLLLDEPTNHLDVPTLDWFDDFLRKSRRALVLISHDREFLNRQIERVLSFEPEGLRLWTGDYDAYRSQRELEEEQLEARAERQAKERAKTEAFIERFRAKNTKASQVKSREKALAKEEIIQVHDRHAEVRFRFPPAERSGREVLRLENVAKRFGDKTVYEGISLQVLRGERIAIVGANGAGKTTLLRVAAGELAPDEGRVVVGHNVRTGFFAQHLAEALERDRTILEEVSALVPDWPQSRVRAVLGSFLFSGDDADKRIGVLSGGERARVALAKLLVVPSNALLMDEPTNHLDLASSETLIEALKTYEGTLLFVSHNRSFVNQLATKVWEVADGQVLEHPGNLDDYLHHKRLLAEQAQAQAAPESAAARGNASNEKERKRLEAEARQARSVREKPVRTEIARIEARIEQLEKQAKDAEAALADPALYNDFARARPHMDAFRAARDELEKLYSEWEARQEALAALQESA